MVFFAVVMTGDQLCAIEFAVFVIKSSHDLALGEAGKISAWFNDAVNLIVQLLFVVFNCSSFILRLEPEF